ncbi:glycosyltransferase [Streptomyces sp. NPDC006422]|uniref:glycosyltransferase n=1 Tax=unclassified Streptomyces TaxID=2593676 RepID=UPI0033B4C36F
MRIAVVHGFGAPGGEDEAVLDQVAALTRAGHEVRLVSAHGRGRGPLAALRAFGPDVVHVHNLFPAYGRAWVADWTGPLVATLRHGPHRGSRLAALQLPWATGRGGPRQDPLLRRADRLVVLSEAGRDACARAGLPRERLDVVPDFVPTVAAPDTASDGGWVCVGRLAPDDGTLELLRRWPAGERLDVVGTGPLEARCRAAAPASVRMRGAAGRGALRRALPGYRGIVLPGRGPRRAVPLVYAEALAAGLPVLAFEGAGESAVPRAVRSEGTGTVTTLDAHLPAALDVAAKVFPTLREHCRTVYAKHYGEPTWLDRTERVYATLRP